MLPGDSQAAAKASSSKEMVTECRDGKWCTRADCKFTHPNGRDIDDMDADVEARELMTLMPRNGKLLNEVREARFAHLRVIGEAKERSGQLLMSCLTPFPNAYSCDSLGSVGCVSLSSHLVC